MTKLCFRNPFAKASTELARDLQMTMLEFQSELNAQVFSMGLTGGFSRVKNMHAYLTQVLEVAVNPTVVLTKDFELSFQPTAADDSICGVALGLAIEGLKKPRNPALNFLKNEFRKKSGCK